MALLKIMAEIAGPVRLPLIRADRNGGDDADLPFPLLLAGGDNATIAPCTFTSCHGFSSFQAVHFQTKPVAKKKFLPKI